MPVGGNVESKIPSFLIHSGLLLLKTGIVFSVPGKARISPAWIISCAVGFGVGFAGAWAVVRNIWLTSNPNRVKLIGKNSVTCGLSDTPAESLRERINQIKFAGNKAVTLYTIILLMKMRLRELLPTQLNHPSFGN